MRPHPAPCPPLHLTSCNLPVHTTAIDGSSLPPPIAVADTDTRNWPTCNLCIQTTPTLCLLRRGPAIVEGSRFVRRWSSPSATPEQNRQWWTCWHSIRGAWQGGSWSLFLRPVRMAAGPGSGPCFKIFLIWGLRQLDSMVRSSVICEKLTTAPDN